MPFFYHRHLPRGIAVQAHKRIHPVETRSGRRDRELRIKRQYHQMIYFIATNLFERVFKERMPVTHTNVSTRADAASAERLFEGTSLLVCYPAKRRPASDLSVVAA